MVSTGSWMRPPVFKCWNYSCRCDARENRPDGDSPFARGLARLIKSSYGRRALILERGTHAELLADKGAIIS